MDQEVLVSGVMLTWTEPVCVCVCWGVWGSSVWWWADWRQCVDSQSVASSRRRSAGPCLQVLVTLLSMMSSVSPSSSI